MKKVGFIGLGNMGGSMAVNLLKHSFDVVGYDLSPQAVSSFQAMEGTVARSLREACEGADVIVTMLPSGNHVSEVYSSALLSQLRPQTLIIDSSTIDPTTARKTAKLAESHGHLMLDAPVSGGTEGAKAGSLTFIVGGPDEALKRALPFLQAMGKNVFHAGPSGAGQVAKICNNLLLAIHMIGTSEALNLGKTQGLDPRILSEIMKQSSGRNWSLEVYNPYPGVMENVPSSRGYQGGFSVGLMNKDLNLALNAAQETKASIPLGETAAKLYKNWNEVGNSSLDFSSIIQILNPLGDSDHEI